LPVTAKALLLIQRYPSNLTGLFASNDPVGFAKAAASVLKLRTEVKGNEVRILEE